VKYKSIFLVFSLIALFFIADSRFNLLLFEAKPSLNKVIECETMTQLNNLSMTLESKDPKTIAEGIRKLESRLRIAAIFETESSGFESNPEPVKVSDLSKNLDVARKEFSKFSKLTTSEISSKISEIQESVRSVKESLKDYC